VLVDERKATRVARDCGLVTAGTLAVLRDAALGGMINFRETVHRLINETNFHHTEALIDQVTADFEMAQRQRRGDAPEREP
jgi:predicted nucleic acid-binding protein